MFGSLFGAILGGVASKAVGGSAKSGFLGGLLGGVGGGLLASGMGKQPGLPTAPKQTHELDDTAKRRGNRHPDRGRASTMTNGNMGYDMNSILKQYLGQ